MVMQRGDENLHNTGDVIKSVAKREHREWPDPLNPNNRTGAKAVVLYGVDPATNEPVQVAVEEIEPGIWGLVSRSSDGGSGLTNDQLRATPVPTMLQGDISAGNSTNTPLPANTGGTDHIFTGQFHDVEDYANIRIVGKTDASSAANGAIIEWSTDGTEATITRQVFTTITAPNFGIYYNTPPQAKYFRIRIVNGTTAQTYLRLQTTLSYAPESQVQQLLGAAITDNNIAGIQKAVLWGKKPDGTYTPVGAPDISINGTIDGVDDTVVLDLGGQSSGAIQVSGTFTMTLQFEATINDTDWFPIHGVQPGPGFIPTATTQTGAYRINCSGLSKVRVRCSDHTTGAATIHIAASVGGGTTVITTPLPSDTYAAAANSLSAAGTTEIVTASSTQKARLYYISLNADGSNAADVTVTVKIGANAIYKVCLKAGGIFARNIGAGRRYLESAASGEDITLTLSDNQIVHYSVEYELVNQ